LAKAGFFQGKIGYFPQTDFSLQKSIQFFFFTMHFPSKKPKNFFRYAFFTAYFIENDEKDKKDQFPPFQGDENAVTDA
jgi:hypothetical protein